MTEQQIKWFIDTVPPPPKKAVRGLDQNRKVVWNSETVKAVRRLANRGFSIFTIATMTGLTPSQVGYRLSRLGVSVINYRRGHSEAAQVELKRVEKLWDR